MTTTQFGTLNTEGIDFNATYTSYDQTAAVTATNSPDNPGPPFSQGFYARGTGESDYVFVKASAAINKGDVCLISTTYTAAGVTTTNATFGSLLGVAQGAIASGAYGWLQRAGTCQNIGTAAAVVTNVQLAATASAGLVDDVTTTGLKSLNGIVTATATSATVVAGVLNYPTVGITN